MDIEEAKENVKKLLKNANPFTMQPYIYFSIETVLNELEKKDKEIEELKNKYIPTVEDYTNEELIEELHSRFCSEYFTNKAENVGE